jgi:hypothetical protein
LSNYVKLYQDNDLTPEQIDRAIERERHNMPTLDELKAKLNGAKFISKIDFKKTFSSIYHDLRLQKL